jgi:NADH:quinone reductase (non-electrogenic)
MGVIAASDGLIFDERFMGSTKGTVRKVAELEGRVEGYEFNGIRALVAGARGRNAVETGELDEGLVWAGQVIGLIDDIPKISELVERIMVECREWLTSALRYYDGVYLE